MGRPSSHPVHPRELVLGALRKSKAPVTAYALLEKLQPKGVKSAPIIYRALAALEKNGEVHRIQAINAYMACRCSAGHSHALSVLTICTGCQKVEELHDHDVIDTLQQLRSHGVALAPNAVVELPVLCADCAG